MKKRNKVARKFYVGHSKMLQQFHQEAANTIAPGRHPPSGNAGLAWPKATLAEAISHAEQILDDNPKQDSAFVVQVVRVVRRRETPKIVEVVK